MSLIISAIVVIIKYYLLTATVDTSVTKVVIRVSRSYLELSVIFVRF
jgi:hypothetical protein